MALYEFACRDCGAKNEELIRSSADTPTQCPSCKSPNYEKQISAPGGISGNFGTVPRRGAGSFKRRK